MDTSLGNKKYASYYTPLWMCVCVWMLDLEAHVCARKLPKLKSFPFETRTANFSILFCCSFVSVHVFFFFTHHRFVHVAAARTRAAVLAKQQQPFKMITASVHTYKSFHSEKNIYLIHFVFQSGILSQRCFALFFKWARLQRRSNNYLVENRSRCECGECYVHIYSHSYACWIWIFISFNSFFVCVCVICAGVSTSTASCVPVSLFVCIATRQTF